MHTQFSKIFLCACASLSACTAEVMPQRVGSGQAVSSEIYSRDARLLTTVLSDEDPVGATDAQADDAPVAGGAWWE